MLAKTINRKTGYEEDNSHENISVSFGTRWRVTCFPDKIEVIKMNEEKFRRVTKVWNRCSGEWMIKTDLEQEKLAKSKKGPLDVEDHRLFYFSQ